MIGIPITYTIIIQYIIPIYIMKLNKHHSVQTVLLLLLLLSLANIPMIIIQCSKISIVIKLFICMISMRVNNELYYAPIVFVCE